MELYHVIPQPLSLSLSNNSCLSIGHTSQEAILILVFSIIVPTKNNESLYSTWNKILLYLDFSIENTLVTFVKLPTLT